MKNIFFLQVLFVMLLTVDSTRAQVPSYVPTSGLLAWYPLNGTANNAYGSGDNGVIYGGVTWGTDRFGYPGACYVGNGSSGIDLPGNNFPTGNATRSISAWYKGVLPFTGPYEEIFATGSNAFIGSRFGSDLESTSVGFESTGFGKRVSITHDSCWHNLTITYPTGGSGMGSVKIYLDGSLATTYYISSMSTLNSDTGNIHAIGALFLPPYNPYTTGAFLYSFQGSIDDVGVWNRELTATEVATLYYATVPISGSTYLCGGATTTLSDTSIGGTWASSDTTIARVSSSGVVTGIGSGTATISYTIGSVCPVTATIVVSVSAPAAITGSVNVCPGSSITLSDATSGGTWSSSNPAIGSVGSTSGVVTGVSSGIVTITYSATFSCGTAHTTKTVTVNPSPTLFSVTGGGNYCAGGTGVAVGLSGSVTGVNYQLYNGVTAVGSPVSGTGSAISFGLQTAAGTYTVIATTALGCSAAMTGSAVVNINPLPVSFPLYIGVSGVTVLCSGTITTSGSHIILGGSQLGINYQLLLGGVPIGTPMVGTSGTIDFGLITSSGTYSVVAVNSLTTCANTMGSVTILPSPAPVTGPDSVCVGSSITLGESTTGGFWSESNGNATISWGLITGITAGLDTISYTLSSSGCSVSLVVTVGAVPSDYVHVPVCVGGTLTLVTSPTGGLWTSGSPSIASIGSTSGVALGVSAGITSITYTLPTGCSIVRPLSVNPLPSLIAGPFSVCTGSAITLSDLAYGGVWSASNGNASIGSAGMVNGLIAGVDTISYTLATGCATTRIITVNPLPGPISGVSTICIGSSVAAYCGTGGGVWSSTGPGCFTVGSSSGIVTAIALCGPIYDLCYTLPTSCSLCLPVTINPLPTISAGTGITICSGTSATLTATGGTTYTWSPGVGLSATTGATVTASPTVATTYTVTGSTGGCSGTATKTVAIGPSLSISAGPGTSICSGSSTTITATGGTTYTWSPSIGLSSTTGASVTANPMASVTYTITGTTAGCNGTATKAITVNPIPTISAGTGVSICGGSSATLTASGGTTYSWSPATGLSSSTGATIIASPSVTTTYTVTGTTGGCNGTATKTVSVNPLPVISAGSGVTICPGSSATLTATGGTTYTWLPTTGLSAITGATVTANPTATTTYTITGTTAGCNGTATKTVTVGPTLSISAGPGTAICTGSSTTMTATGGTSYTWSPSAGLSATTGTSVTANPATTTTYTIVGTTAGCSGTGVTTLTVTPIPSVSAGAGVVICSGTSATLSATGGATYTWSPSTGLSASTGASVTASPGATTIYTVTGTTAGCSGRATKTVTVNASPTISAGAGVTICPGASTIMTASGGTTYTWSPGTGLSTTTGTSVTANPSATTTYTVSGTTAGCSGTATKTVTIGSSLSISAGAGVALCSGSSTSFAATGGTTYTWSPSTGLSATTGASVTANPTATITYTVIGTTGSCTGTATKMVTVNALPVISAGPGTAICGGSSTGLTVTGGTTYTWSPSTGLSATTGASVTATPLASTTYTVTGTTAGCNGTATNTVSVNALPVISAGPGITVCSGSSATLTASGGTTYTWSPSTGLSATTGASVIANPSASITYTITGTTDACSGVATKTVTVSAVAGTISGATSLCQGTTTLLTDAIPGGTWHSSATTIATIDLSTGLLTGTGAGVTIISYTSPGGCNATMPITVNATPPAITGSTHVCSGATTTLADPMTGGAWSSSNTTIATVSTTGLVTSFSGGTVTISYASAAGCAATHLLTVNTVPSITGLRNMCAWGDTLTVHDSDGTGVYTSSLITVANLGGGAGTITSHAPGIATISYIIPAGCTYTATITVNPLPGPVSGVMNVCPGAATTLYNTATGGDWTSATPAIATIGSSSGILTGIATGSTRITYTLLSTGCYIDTVVHVLPLPSYIVGFPTMVITTTTTYTDATPGGTWSSGNPAIASVAQTSGVIHGLSVGVVTITYTASTGCITTKSLTVNLPGGTGPGGTPESTNVSGSEIRVIPNPNKGEFTITGILSETMKTEDEEVLLEVTDLLGKVVYTNKVAAPYGYIDNHLSLRNDLPNGMYLLSIGTGPESKMVHIVVSR